MNKRIRTYHHLIPEVQKNFPELNEDQIEMIIKEGLYQIQRKITFEKKDVFLKNSYHKLSMIFFKYMPKFLKTESENGNSEEHISDT